MAHDDRTQDDKRRGQQIYLHHLEHGKLNNDPK